MNLLSLLLLFFTTVSDAAKMPPIPTPRVKKSTGVERYVCKSENYPLDKLTLKLIDATLMQIRYTGAKEDQYFALLLPTPKGSLHFPALYLGTGNTLRTGFQNKKKFLDKVYFSSEEEGTEIVFNHLGRNTHYLCETEL